MAKVKGEGSIYQRASDGRWCASVDLGYDGQGRRQRKVVTAKTRGEVIKKRRAMLRDVEDGVVLSSTSSPTVSSWLTHWLDSIARERLHPRVHRNYVSQVNRHIIPAIGRYKLDKLTPADIRAMHKKIGGTTKASGEGNVSTRTVEVCHNTLSRALKDAVREGLIRDNPCDRVDRPKVKANTREGLTAEAAKAILAAAAPADDLASMWAAALLVGARKSELTGLEWDRVDFERHTIDLSWQLQILSWVHGCGAVDKDGVGRCGKMRPSACPDRSRDVPDQFDYRECRGALCWTRPKTRSSMRVVPMPALLEQALLRHRETAPSNEHGLVWVRPDGHPWLPDQALERWYAACDAAGVPRVVMHSTRHTTATLLLEAGVAPEVIAQIVGHSTILSTRSYMHVDLSLAAAALGRLGDLLEEGEGPAALGA